MTEESSGFIRFWQFLVLVFLIGVMIGLTACVRIYDTDGKEMVFRESRLDGPEGLGLFASVKGSIYGAGEFVSVFGNCLDVNDAGVVGSYGKLSAWYPNGTQLFTNATMSQIQTGYFIYIGYMDPVQGTYLTEFTCRVNGTSQVAVAFGEWQNPYWVTRIANAEMLSNQSVSLVNQAISLLTAVNQTLYAQNAALFASLNQSMYLLSQQLNGVAVNLSAQIGASFQVIMQNNAMLNQLCYGNTTGVEIFFEGNVTTLYECPVLQGLGGENSTNEALEAAQLQLAIDLLNALCFANTTGVTVSFNVTPQLYECTTLQNIQSSLDALQVQVSLLNQSVSDGFNQTMVWFGWLNTTTSYGFDQVYALLGNLSSQVSVGFNQTYNLFGVMNVTLTQGFNQTQSAIEGLNSSVQQGFNQTNYLVNQTFMLVNGLNVTVVQGFNQTYVMIGDVIVLINGLNSTIVSGFNQTFSMINQTNSLVNQTLILVNQTYTNLSQQIQYVSVVANASVDRNDSYLADLIRQILVNGTPSTGPAGSLSFTESFEEVKFRRMWTINVTVLIGTTQVGSEYVACFINTTNSPPTEFASMEPITGPKFTYSELVKSVDSLDWSVWCVRT